MAIFGILGPEFGVECRKECRDEMTLIAGWIIIIMSIMFNRWADGFVWSDRMVKEKNLIKWSDYFCSAAKIICNRIIRSQEIGINNNSKKKKAKSFTKFSAKSRWKSRIQVLNSKFELRELNASFLFFVCVFALGQRAPIGQGMRIRQIIFHFELELELYDVHVCLCFRSLALIDCEDHDDARNSTMSNRLFVVPNFVVSFSFKFTILSSNIQTLSSKL